MARKSASKPFIQTTTWNGRDLQPGSTLEGYYICAEVFDGQYGTTSKFVIETKAGEMFGIYASASITRQFDNVPVGCYVWVTYNGEVTSKNGRTVRDYSVEYDDEIKK